jgi:hypothetical protein
LNLTNQSTESRLQSNSNNVHSHCKKVTIGRQRMDRLSLLTNESDLVNCIDYDDVINTFAECKAIEEN